MGPWFGVFLGFEVALLGGLLGLSWRFSINTSLCRLFVKVSSLGLLTFFKNMFFFGL